MTNNIEKCERKYRYQHRNHPIQLIVWAYTRAEADRMLRLIYGQNQWVYMNDVALDESFGVGL